MATALKPLKLLHPRSPDTKYTGSEPEWRSQPDDSNRVGRLTAAFSWYNYHYGKKDAKEFMLDWLMRNDRSREAKDFGRVPDNAVNQTLGWLARMNLVGLVLLESERNRLDTAIREHIAAARATKEVVKEADAVVNKPNIQDRLRDRMREAAGEIEGMYDDMILAGAKMSADYKPITVLRSMNIAPQMVGEISDIWQRHLAELEEVQEGKDAQLVEGYSHLGKLQIRNLVKFAEQVIADCASYRQLKKVERKPRAKKAVSPEKLTARFKYLREFAELKLVSEPVTKLVGASEAWLYDTKKRKLIHVMADPHVQSFSVKGTAIVGFDGNTSQMKTLRKPAEQLKALMSGGLPQMRKTFKDIRATETKFNGRGNENIVLLKIK